MKTFTLKTILSVLFAFLIFSANAKTAPRKAEIVIKSTVECALCKKNLETNLSKVKGIRKVVADFTKKEITVVYNPRRITPEEIRKKIADIGYDADDVKANNRMTQLLKHKEEQKQQQK